MGRRRTTDKSELLRRRYLDAKRVSSYGGVTALKRASRTPIRFVKKWLSEQDTYTLHKPVRTAFKRRCVVVGGPHQQWQADLVDVSNLKKDNDGITFLLTVIDVFSKWAWCVPLKNKSASSLVMAFRELLSDIKPMTLQTDKGLEFRNRSFQALLKKHGVHHFSTHNEETKASIVERFDRTLKTRMWRYFTKHQTVRYLDKLHDFMWSYNNTYHRSLGMAPSNVNETNQDIVWQRLYGRGGGGNPKFMVGDRVQISKAKRQFENGYMANWTEELFTVSNAHRSDPPVYKLVDDHGELVDGSFYEPELQKVLVSKDKLYRIETVLQRRRVSKRTEVLVKWYGYAQSFNSWIDSKALVRYKTK